MGDAATDTPPGLWAAAGLDEAITLRRRLGPEAALVAGATDLGVAMRRRAIRPRHLISVGRIPELLVLERSGDEIVIGAAVTHRRIERSGLFTGAYRALAEACETVGSPQTRNVGTIGGNLANASPAADTAPVLIAFGATVELTGPDGSRTLALDDFFLGYRSTALGDDEVLTAVRLPVPVPGTGSAFVKLGRRRAMEISIACVGATVTLDGDGRCTAVGVGLGSVAPTPVRAAAVEEALSGRVPDEEALRAAAAAALSAADPIDDQRASAAYRRAVLPELVRRALRTAAERAAS